MRYLTRLQEIICIYPNIFAIIDGYNCSPNFQFCLEGKFKAVRWQQKYYICRGSRQNLSTVTFWPFLFAFHWIWLPLITPQSTKFEREKGISKLNLLAVLQDPVWNIMHAPKLEHSWYDGANCQNRPLQIHTNLCAPCGYKFLLCNIIFKSFKVKLARQKAMSAQKKKVSYSYLWLRVTLCPRPTILHSIINTPPPFRLWAL